MPFLKNFFCSGISTIIIFSRPPLWDNLHQARADGPELRDKKALVPSGGDDHAVFAFALMGAQGTSCDISHKQIENAKKIAERYSLSIEFLVDDPTQLKNMPSDAYDFVYTAEGVHVWY